MGHSELSFARPLPLPMRAPVLAAAGFGHHTGHHHHHLQHHGHNTPTFTTMADPAAAAAAFLASDEELAQLQKLSNDFEPDVEVSLFVCLKVGVGEWASCRLCPHVPDLRYDDNTTSHVPTTTTR